MILVFIVEDLNIYVFMC
jgi:hypothetical protein